jgi:hypothetical protein
MFYIEPQHQYIAGSPIIIKKKLPSKIIIITLPFVHRQKKKNIYIYNNNKPIIY